MLMGFIAVIADELPNVKPYFSPVQENCTRVRGSGFSKGMVRPSLNCGATVPQASGLEARGVEPLLGPRLVHRCLGLFNYLGKEDSRISTNGHERARMFLVQFLPWRAIGQDHIRFPRRWYGSFNFEMASVTRPLPSSATTQT
jgi:hypothetical protein